MVCDALPPRNAVVRHLNAALAADAEAVKNFHLRQAMQMLSLRGYPVP